MTITSLVKTPWRMYANALSQTSKSCCISCQLTVHEVSDIGGSEGRALQPGWPSTVTLESSTLPVLTMRSTHDTYSPAGRLHPHVSSAHMHKWGVKVLHRAAHKTSGSIRGMLQQENRSICTHLPHTEGHCSCSC